MNFFKRLFLPKASDNLVKVYSHPRSGTHFMEAFLAQNFYPNQNLDMTPITWGHWSNRKVKHEGNPYGKLFGNHYFADRNENSLPKIYMMRDGRSVAYSVWKTPNFVHPDLESLSFSEFLRTKIDWYGTPSKRVEPNQTILEHWYAHVESWKALEKANDNVLLINYEDLIDSPYTQYKKIHDAFFSNTKQLSAQEISIIEKPLGLLPNKGKKDSWRDIINEKDKAYIASVLSSYNFKDEL
ncbi:sulfotransferase domain-containing protein [Psychroserpens algicola]|uniref:sulfotransferase domain-containing protein n=1 Tax=Psychroserpens algicola TaxID=1719034 RepID=UPI0019543BB3|nr:sulfotransferase domain-containing protein [Psychroserpens algicola]